MIVLVTLIVLRTILPPKTVEQ